jgi:hypothetical protein
MLPSELAWKLEPSDLVPSARTKLSQREVAEFRKTAAVVEKEPWRMHKSAVYLREWVARNQSGQVVEPSLPEFIFRKDNRESLWPDSIQKER